MEVALFFVGALVVSMWIATHLISDEVKKEGKKNGKNGKN